MPVSTGHSSSFEGCALVITLTTNHTLESQHTSGSIRVAKKISSTKAAEQFSPVIKSASCNTAISIATNAQSIATGQLNAARVKSPNHVFENVVNPAAGIAPVATKNLWWTSTHTTTRNF